MYDLLPISDNGATYGIIVQQYVLVTNLWCVKYSSLLVRHIFIGRNLFSIRVSYPFSATVCMLRESTRCLRAQFAVWTREAPGCRRTLIIMAALWWGGMGEFHWTGIVGVLKVSFLAQCPKGFASVLTRARRSGQSLLHIRCKICTGLGLLISLQPILMVTTSGDYDDGSEDKCIFTH